VPDLPSLPEGLLARPASSGDLEDVVALCLRCDLADLGTPDTDKDDVLAARRRPGFDLAKDTVLVLAAGASEAVAHGDVYDGRRRSGTWTRAGAAAASAAGCWSSAATGGGAGWAWRCCATGSRS
jgi:hypothetical protein